MKRGFLNVNGLRLGYVDFGGEGKPAILLLHGMFGRATTWAETASWLTDRFHVVGLDQRGHGLSDKPDRGYGRQEYVGDAAEAIRQLGLAPAIVIGHSMGGMNAWQLAAWHPELVRAVVIEDMPCVETKGAGWVTEWLSTWPVPFPTLAAARAFFGAQRPSWADFFGESLHETEEGYRPLFQLDHMIQTSEGLQGVWWDDLEQVRCPALVVKGERSSEDREVLQEMARRLPQGRYAEVKGAYHTVHVDEPEGWRAALEPFLESLL
jgi:pimeloyl-ACP methyl ester carboxylesterase